MDIMKQLKNTTTTSKRTFHSHKYFLNAVGNPFKETAEKLQKNNGHRLARLHKLTIPAITAELHGYVVYMIHI
jgi:hypothetical protein